MGEPDVEIPPSPRRPSARASKPPAPASTPASRSSRRSTSSPAPPRSPFNAALSGRRLRELGAPTPDAVELLTEVADRFALSARAHDRILRVARTVADLAESDVLTADHVAEALQFR